MSVISGLGVIRRQPVSDKFGLIDVRSLGECRRVDQGREGISGMANHPIGNLVILLVLAGCGSMQRWSQDDLRFAERRS